MAAAHVREQRPKLMPETTREHAAPGPARLRRTGGGPRNLLPVPLSGRTGDPWGNHRQQGRQRHVKLRTRSTGNVRTCEPVRELGKGAVPYWQRDRNRTGCNEWKRRFRIRGFDGFEYLPPVQSHPQTTRPEGVERIKGPALEHPDRGRNRHGAMLAREGLPVWPITGSDGRERGRGRGRAQDRPLAALEEQKAGTTGKIPPERAALLERPPPCVLAPNDDVPSKPSRHSSAERVRWTGRLSWSSTEARPRDGQLCAFATEGRKCPMGSPRMTRGSAPTHARYRAWRSPSRS